MLSEIPVETNVDFNQDRDHWFRRCRRVVYTGPIDALFDHSLGTLNWRSVELKVERLNVSDYQGTSVLNYADADVPHTRIHEPKHLHPERDLSKPKTLIQREYSCQLKNDPYYPVNATEDRSLLKQYQALANQDARLVLGGRLAEYKYLDMHQVIGAALRCARDELLGRDLRPTGS